MSHTFRLTIGLIAILGCAHAAGAPPTRVPPAAAPRPVAPADGTPAMQRRDIAKLALGEGVVAVYARGDGRVEVGASAPGGSLVLQLVPSDVEQWATITAKILKSPARARRGHSNVERSTLAEPGVTAGALTFSRRVEHRSITYDLFFADRHFGGFPLRITERDADVLVTTLRTAASVAQAMRSAPSDTAGTPLDTTREGRRS